MPTRTAPICCAALLSALALGSPLAAADAPTAASTRAQIDQLVAARVSAHKPANLGLLRDVVGLATTYGGSAFNAGDIAGCAKFYLATAANLGSSFPGATDASAGAQPGMHDLADAVARCKAMSDATQQSWTLRFAFDQIVLAAGVSQGVAQAQVQFGSQYFARGNLVEADLAFGRAEQAVHELIGAEGGADLGAIQVNARVAGIVRAQVLLARGQLKESAELMQTAVLLLPELPNSNFDWRKVAGDPDPDKHMAAAGDAAHAHPDDLACGLLFAIEQKYNGHAADAATALAALDKAHPGTAAVQLLLGQKPTAPVPAPKAPTAGGAGEFVP